MRAVDLAHALGLNGRISGHNYWVKDPRRPDGGKMGTFAIHTGRGIWKDWSQDEGGDLIHLAAVFACGGDDKRAVKWCLDWLGWTQRKPDPREMARLKAKAAEADARARQAEDDKRRAAQALWLNARPLDGRDPASLYLRARGIDLGRFKDGFPRSLRYAPDCMAYPEDRKMPALLACITREPIGIMACHRTYLAQDNGVWSKAFKGQMRDDKRVPAKRVLGGYAGGSIRLTRGLSGKALGNAPAGEWIAIGEGIENVLTVAQARPDLRCLAAVSLSNLGNVVLPPQIGGVYVLADNDTNPETLKAFDRAMDSLALRGHEPVVVRANAEFKDINDAVMQA